MPEAVAPGPIVCHLKEEMPPLSPRSPSSCDQTSGNGVVSDCCYTSSYRLRASGRGETVESAASAARAWIDPDVAGSIAREVAQEQQLIGAVYDIWEKEKAGAIKPSYRVVLAKECIQPAVRSQSAVPQPSSVARGRPNISATDLWQIEQLESVRYSVPGGGSPISPVENMFGSTGGAEGGNAVLANGKAAGTVHTVEWVTRSPVTINRINLFVGHDRGVPSGTQFKSRDARARGISKFELFAFDGNHYVSVFIADVRFRNGDAVDAARGQPSGNQPTGEPDCRYPRGCFGGLYDPVYAGAGLSGPGVAFASPFADIRGSGFGSLIVSGDLPPTTSRQWRAQFTQVGNYLDGYNDTGGPRVLELDGLGEFQHTSASH